MRGLVFICMVRGIECIYMCLKSGLFRCSIGCLGLRGNLWFELKIVYCFKVFVDNL